MSEHQKQQLPDEEYQLAPAQGPLTADPAHRMNSDFEAQLWLCRRVSGHVYLCGPIDRPRKQLPALAVDA